MNMLNRAEQIFAAALTLSDTAERAALVQRECAGDETLRTEVESLLAAHDQAAGFMRSEQFRFPNSGGTVEPAKAGTPNAPTVLAPGIERSGERIGRYK